MMISICSIFRLLKQVRLFDFSNNLIKDDGCNALIQSIQNGFYPHLEILKINNIGITFHAFEKFITALCSGKTPNFHTFECSCINIYLFIVNNIGDMIYVGFEILSTSTNLNKFNTFKFNSIFI